MAGGFRRTITFASLTTSNTSLATTVATKRSSYKTRSSSLPVRFHPIISNLDDDVASLRRWSDSSPSPKKSRSSTWLLDSVDLISSVLASLSDLLCHPQAIDPLRSSPITDPFLDDLMRLADSYSSFRITLINLSHLQAETQAALRRSDSARLVSAMRAQRHVSKDMVRLATRAKAATQTKPSLARDDVAVLPVAFCDATFALAGATAEMISGLAALSNEATGAISLVIPMGGGPVKLLKIWWVVGLLRWKSRAQKRAKERKKKQGGGSEGRRMERGEMERKVAMEKLDDLGNCVKELESGSEKAFRALVNARVSVLNILTPTI